MNEMHSLQYCLEHSKKIVPHRRDKIFFVLSFNHGIVDWDDLVEWRPNYKHSMYGLSRNEVMFLEELRKEELRVRKAAEMGKLELKTRLIRRTPESQRGEAIRAYNILIANGITNLRLLVAYSNKQLRALKGIGPVRYDILRKAK